MTQAGHNGTWLVLYFVHISEKKIIILFTHATVEKSVGFVYRGLWQ
jgi:hypothetical protein